ncbi:T9SS type A sorting domain-containing protein [Epilithonimonas sp.]|uniref:T9SS type A sorting domain-containing protein n=1 Tax=Epilithonimonas sp. TaxID=2894511 RepID=UPI0035AF3C75
MQKIFTIIAAIPVLMFISSQMHGQQTIYSENFSYSPGGVPPGWQILAEQPPGWSVNNSQISGGTAPELYMTYGMQVGLSRLVSPKITVSGYKKLSLSYNQYLINFLGDAGESIGVDVTFDNGNTWQPLWERPLGVLNIPQDRFTYLISVPENANEMQYAFRYDGNCFFINGWAVDDVKIDAVAEHDLMVSNISGNTTINAGKPAQFLVEVSNGGKTREENYTIKLMSGDGQLLSTASGEAIEFGEKSQNFLSWTPQAETVANQKVYASVESSGDADLTNNRSKDLSVSVIKGDVKNVQIGSGSFALQHSIPFNFFTHYSLGQTMYTASQIGKSEATITGIQYTCQFDEDNDNIPIQIFLAETDQEDLSSEWLDPAGFTKVFDGNINFKKGLNNLYIPLQTEFNYKGKNLVVYTNKSHPEMVLWSTFISTFSEEPIYSRYSERDDEPYDANNPPAGYPVLYTPNITLFYSDGTMSVIDSQKAPAVQIYPNPASEFLKLIPTGNQKLLQVKLVNAAGQTVLDKKEISGNSLDIRSVAAGWYIVEITTDREKIRKKIIIK